MCVHALGRRGGSLVQQAHAAAAACMRGVLCCMAPCVRRLLYMQHETALPRHTPASWQLRPHIMRRPALAPAPCTPAPPVPRARTQRVADRFGALAHEDWRAGHEKAQGAGAPRMKRVSDAPDQVGERGYGAGACWGVLGQALLQRDGAGSPAAR